MIRAGLILWHLVAAAAHLIAIWTLTRPTEARQAVDAAERMIRQGQSR